jgi:LEA14-like dessication related protein
MLLAQVFIHLGMKKALKILLIVIVLALLSLGVYLYFNPKKALNIVLPEAKELSELDIRLDDDTAHISLKIHVKNKSLFKLNMDSLMYAITVDTATMLSKTQKLNVQLKRSQEDTVLLPIAIPYKRLSNKIKASQGKDSLDIGIYLKLVYRTVFGETSLPFQKTIRIEVPRQPKFEITHVEFLKRKKKTGYFMVDVMMHNYGKIDLKVSDLKYRMKVEDLFTADGRHPETVVIKPKSHLVFKLPVKVEFKKMFKTISKVISNNDKVNYVLKVDAFVQNDKVDAKKTPLKLTKQGQFELKK